MKESVMKESAIKKLKNTPNLTEQHKLIINHLVKRCNEDEGFAEDVLKEGKTFEKCFLYIQNKAKAQAVNRCAVIEDATVYEWAEDYFRMTDEPKPEAIKKPSKPSTSGGQKKKAEPKPVSTESGQYSLF